MDAPHLIGAIVGIAASVITGLGVLAAAALAAWAKIRPILREIQAASRVSAHELQHNSGTSMKDSLRRIEERQREQGADLRQLREETAEALDDVRDQIRTDRDHAQRARDDIYRRTTALEVASANGRTPNE